MAIPTLEYTTNVAGGGTVTHNVGAAGNNRLILFFALEGDDSVDDISSVTVSGNSFTEAPSSPTESSLRTGNTISCRYIFESNIGATGSQTIGVIGDQTTHRIVMLTFYGVDETVGVYSDEGDIYWDDLTSDPIVTTTNSINASSSSRRYALALFAATHNDTATAITDLTDNGPDTWIGDNQIACDGTRHKGRISWGITNAANGFYGMAPKATSAGWDTTNKVAACYGIAFEGTTDFDGTEIYVEELGINNVSVISSEHTAVFPDRWQRRCPIVIPAANVTGSANHTDFPVLLTHLDLPADMKTGVEAAQTDGGDIRFTSDVSGNTVLPHETVVWDSAADDYEIWVKVPTLYYNQDTTIYVWYNADFDCSPEKANATYGAQAVWSDYFFVSHDGITESTGNADLEIRTGSGGAGVDGPFSGGLNATNFTARSSRAWKTSVSAFDLSIGNHTLQCWANKQGGVDDKIFEIKDNDGTDFMHFMANNDSETIATNYRFGCLLYNIDKVKKDVPNADGYHMMHGQIIANNTLGKFFFDSVEVTDLGTGNHWAGNEENWISIGAETQEPGLLNTNQPYTGYVAECRYRESLLSPDWISTEYTNQTSTFATAGTPIDNVLYDQEGFRWRSDDGSESGATWLESQDVVYTGQRNTNVRLRMLSDNDNQSGGNQALTLQYRKVGDPDMAWRDIE